MTIATSLIFAMARNRAIGMNGDIPWHLPEDLKRFKALTLGHPCIMGRKTFESILARLGKPLSGRTSIVVSRSGFLHEGTLVFPELTAAIDAARDIAARDGKDQIFIIGGAQIYTAAMPIADRLYVTEVDLSPEADAFMPEWDINNFKEVGRVEHTNPPPPFRFIDLQRVVGR